MEIELKLLVEPGDNEKLQRHPLIERHADGKPKHADLVATYFDTPDFQLRKSGAGLRVRREGDKWIQTMKAGGSVQGGLHSRNEWEGPVDGELPNLPRLRDIIDSHSEWAALIGSPKLASRLVPMFTVQVRRTAWKLRVEGDQIELVLDQGSIRHGDKEVPVNEIELELKSGKPARLYDVAMQLLKDVPMRVGHASKAERGYALFGQGSPEVVKTQPPLLDRGLNVEQGMQAIIGNCLAQIEGNEVGVIDGGDPENLHQMRVGLRRLRSALKLFKEVVPCPAELKEELRWLGKELGAARDWDVLSTSTLESLPAMPAGIPRSADLRNMATSMARDKRQEAARALRSTRYARLMLSFSAWMQSAPWREAADPAQHARLDEPLKKFAGRTLSRGHGKLIKRGKHLRGAAPEALHRLRIAGKENRYAVEFFQSLCRPKRARRYAAALAAMQDELGLRNDIVVAQQLLQDLKEHAPDVAEATAFASGFLMGGAHSSEDGLRRKWKQFRSLKTPF